MTSVPYISIKSVLYDLVDVIPERYWNERKFLEWANKGLRRTDIPHKYEPCIKYIAVEEHKAVLPLDLRYVVQIAYYTNTTDTEIVELLQSIMNTSTAEWNPAIVHMASPTGLAEKAAAVYSQNNTSWAPMYLSSNPFLNAITCTPAMFPEISNNCYSKHEGNIDISGILTTTLQTGVIALSYLRYPKNDLGDALIPDIESLKEAIFNYCLWKYYLQKDIIGEANAAERADKYKVLFGHMARKAAAELNTPDLMELENLKNITNRLVPRGNQFSNFFSKLGNQENLTY